MTLPWNPQGAAQRVIYCKYCKIKSFTYLLAPICTRFHSVYMPICILQ